MSNLCDGRGILGPVQLTNSRAYCEGLAAAAAGEAVGTDPHPAGSEAAAAWITGHVNWAKDPANLPEQSNCCAHAFGGGYIP